MDIISIIDKKRTKERLSRQEIEFAVMGYVEGSVAPEQMSALLMAICINGLDEEEIFSLCEVMKDSGKTLDLSKIGGVTCDKHSTGGVSDSTTLILLPIIACLNLHMVKMSGRGLGFTGGTADKIEVFEGIKLDLSEKTAIMQTRKIGGCLMTQSESLCPADKKLYALRDVTGTVQSLPLIATSIMSKKLATNCDVLVLDVKYGKGALIKSYKEAKKLASIMVKIGKNACKKVVAIISDMNQPLGYCIGDKLEVVEAVEALKGKQSNLSYLAMFLATQIYSIASGCDFATSEKLVKKALDSGDAYEKFVKIITTQHGIFKIPSLVGVNKYEVLAEQSGYVAEVDPCILANFVRFNGGGRVRKEDTINPNVGIKTFVKVGDFVNKGDKLMEVFVTKKTDLTILKDAVKITKRKVKPLKLICEVIQ